MEYYSVLKRKEILTQATTWINLEDIMLSETKISQLQNINAVLFHLYEVIRVVKYMETKQVE